MKRLMLIVIMCLVMLPIMPLVQQGFAVEGEPGTEVVKDDVEDVFDDVDGFLQEPEDAQGPIGPDNDGPEVGGERDSKRSAPG